MADLIAQGSETHQRWRHRLPEGEQLILGRGAVALSVPWDDCISREHLELRWSNGRLQVRRRPSAMNPVFVEGQQVDDVLLVPGQHFVIGKTSFTLTNDQANVSMDMPRPIEQQTFSSQELKQVRFRHADRRIEVLSRLPDVISGSATESEMLVRLVNMLLAGITRADAVALVARGESRANEPPIRVLYWDRRLAVGTEFRPSQGLIQESLRRKESVLHVWRGAGERSQADFTLSEGVDWAFATPVLNAGDADWAVYVAGRFGPDGSSDTSDLGEDLKFSELVASTLSALRQVRLLQGQNAVLSQFFSPLVLRAMGAQDANVVLTPRETDVAILFCDLRGFSLEAERSQANLLGLLERVSRALGVMTRQIRDSGGVIGDYQGDAAMGFWGWPLEQPDAAERACLAALAIRREFEEAARRPNDPLSGFRAGIGIAMGRAVAGKIGTDDQVKVTVFGPVVNLASRLEGMTKILSAPILMDKTVAEVARTRISRAKARCRKVAVVKPYGMATPLEVSELLPPESEYPKLTDEHIAYYESAVTALQKGNWSEAFDLLHRVPPDDRVKDFLTVLIAEHHRTAPTTWDGVIRLNRKN